MLTVSNCVKRPLKEAGASRQSARITSMASVARAPRRGNASRSTGGVPSGSARWTRAGAGIHASIIARAPGERFEGPVLETEQIKRMPDLHGRLHRERAE